MVSVHRGYHGRSTVLVVVRPRMQPASRPDAFYSSFSRCIMSSHILAIRRICIRCACMARDHALNGVHFSPRLAHYFVLRTRESPNQSLERNREARCASFNLGFDFYLMSFISASVSLRPPALTSIVRRNSLLAGHVDHGLAFVRQRHRALLAIGPVPQRRSEGLRICLRDVPPTPESLCAL